MFKKPVLNALGASAYIVGVSSLMNFVSQSQRDTPDTIFAPILLLSFLTLSVAVMAYLFFYYPLQLFVDGKKKESVAAFIQTIAVFAVLTIALSLVAFSGLIQFS